VGGVASAAMVIAQGVRGVVGEESEPVRGERVSVSPVVIEGLAEALERERLRPKDEVNPKLRNGRPGSWRIGSHRSTYYPHSGVHHALVKWGDVRMGIGFRGPVDLHGLWIAGQAAKGVWAEQVRAVGYRDGLRVSETEWFRTISERPRWFAMELEAIDRVVLEARPVVGKAAWYAIDDIAFTRRNAQSMEAERTVVVDFEDGGWGQTLTGSDYAGLEWETGTGFVDEGVHAPEAPPREEEPFVAEAESLSLSASMGGTAPTLLNEFQTLRMGQYGSSYPPDTCGAVGPTQVLVCVNRAWAVYDKVTGTQLAGMGLTSFLPGSNGDPRVAYDQHHDRWVVLVSDFSNEIHLAYSLTSDALGSWIKTKFNTSQGSDAGDWPDHETLGVSAEGIFTAAYMVGSGSTMTLFAIDKAPLLAASPSLGTVTAFRGLPWEGALQPCHTFGSPGVEYVVSVNASNRIRVRRVNGPLSSPTLQQMGYITVGSHPDPPNAPAQGSTTALDTVDDRLINAVYRDGSIWTAHTVNQSGRAAARWYELQASPLALIQSGTVADSTRHFFFPSIAVNSAGDVVLGCSGSHSGEYAGAWYTGRKVGDPTGAMATPVLYRAGNSPQNNIDSYGRNRWGDYSLTVTDPSDGTFWTMQEYANTTDRWGTHVAQLDHGSGTGGGGCDAPDNFCSSTPNSAGWGATMGFSGSASYTANDLSLECYGCPPNQFGIFYYGPNQIITSFGNGFRCVGGGFLGTFRLPIIQTDSFGDAFYSLDYAQAPMNGGNGTIVDGMEFNFQFWFRDPGQGSNFNLSDGLHIVFCP
jgi:hypothetical protein